MKRLCLLTTAMILSTSVYAADKFELKTEKQKLSYTIGVDIGSTFAEQRVPIDSEALQQGMLDALQDKPLQLTDEEMEQIIRNFQQGIVDQRMQQFSELAEENLVDGEAFLKENQTKSDVVVLDSGLQYRVIEAGTGNQPKADDEVTVIYKGILINGEVFDSSSDHGENVTLRLNQVIPGWQEALVLMKEGAKWEIFVPADLAYGEQGFGIIGPNETLIFEIELISVQ